MNTALPQLLRTIEAPPRAALVGFVVTLAVAGALLAALVTVARQAVQRGHALREVTAAATSLSFHCRMSPTPRERDECLAQPPPVP